MDTKNMMDHLRSHQSYPATKTELVAECDNLSDFSQKDKEWFKKALPEGTYNSAEEVVKTLGIGEMPAGAMA